MSKLFVTSAALTASLLVLAPVKASAQFTHDKLTLLTFSGPVQVPGATLSAGTYRFRLTDPDTSRKVMQVLSYDGGKVYSMFNTIPDVRTRVTYKAPVVSFMEVPADVPPPIRTLWYEGESIGYSFVYPKGGPVVTAPERPQPAITYSAAPEAIVPSAVPEAAPAPAAEPAPAAAAEPPAEPAPVALPKTATALPWAAAGGLTTLLLGLGIGLLRRE